MPFFASEAQYQKVQLAWDLMLATQATDQTLMSINEQVTAHGTENVGSLLDQDGHAKLPDGWNEVGLQNDLI